MRRYISLFIGYLQYERNYSVHTVKSYTNDLSQFADFVEEKEAFDGELFGIDRIDADLVRQWMMTLMKQSLSSASVNRKLSALQSLFTYLVRQGIVQKHPLRFVSGPKQSKTLPCFVKEKEMEVLLDTEEWRTGLNQNEARAFGLPRGDSSTERDSVVDDSEKTMDDFEKVRNQLMMELFYETGIRCSELVGLKDVDVDTEAMLLKVTGKRNKQRLIPFADRLKKMILYYINVRKRKVGEGNGAAFFVRKDGRPVTSAIVYYAVKKRLSEIPALAKRGPHVLRHTFATSMLNDGAEISAVRNLLGHSSLASTSVYTHVTFEELKKVYHAHPRAKK